MIFFRYLILLTCKIVYYQSGVRARCGPDQKGFFKEKKLLSTVNVLVILIIFLDFYYCI
jgi:hypothetical protein